MSGQVSANGNYLRRTTSFSGAITVSCWVRFTSVAAGLTSVWSQDNNADFNPSLYRDTTNLRFVTSGLADDVILSGLATTNWYWVGIVYEPGVNTNWYTRTNLGNIASGASTQSGGGYGSTRMTIFNEDANDQALNGQIAAFKVWTGRLSVDQLYYESLIAMPKFTTNLYAYLPLHSGGASAGVDLSGNGNAWTVTGTIASSRLSPPIAWGGI